MAVQDAPRARRRRPATGRDMVLSMLVLVAGIVAITVVRPHASNDPIQTVDVGTQVQVLAGAAPYTLLSPAGLPTDWRPTSIHATTPEAVGRQVAELSIGYVVDRKPRTFAQLVESNAPAAAVLTGSIGPRPVSGTVQVGGVAWAVRRDGAGHLALTRTAGTVTYVVTDGGGGGGASQADLEVLAGSLRAVPKP